MVKVRFSLYTCCNLRGLGGSRKMIKNRNPSGINKSLKSRHCSVMVEFFPGMDVGQGFSLCWRLLALDPRWYGEGSTDFFLEFYNSLGAGGSRNSRESCKYEGGELNYWRKPMILISGARTA